MDINYKEHWDKVYSNSEVNKLGWYEEIPQPSIKLIEKCNLKKNSVILDVGTGATSLIPYLLEKDYTNIIALDISEEVIKKTSQGLKSEDANKVKWVIDDIANPKLLNEKVDLWHDRTVLHFLIDEKQQEGYLTTLNRIVKPGGYVIIAVFSLAGAKKCSGLDVKNYNEQMISKFLGNEYELLDNFYYIYVQPSGNERPFVYTLFKRKVV